MTWRGLRTSFMDGPFRDLDGPDAEDEGAGREVKDGAEEGEQQVLKPEYGSAGSCLYRAQPQGGLQVA